MIQTLALLHAAYRELNARKLFWITLGLSGLVIAAMASIGLNEQGLSVLWWQFDLALLGLHYMEPLVQLAEGVLMIVAAAIAYQSSVIMACGPSWVHLADPILGVFLTLMQVGKACA